MHLQLQKLRLLWRQREKRWTCNPKLSHIYLTNIAEDPPVLPGNIKWVENIQKLQDHWKCVLWQPGCIGTYCYVFPDTGVHHPLNHERLECWAYGISSLYLIFPHSLTIICSSKLTCCQILKSHPSIVFLTQRSLYVLQFSNVASMHRMQKDQLVLWPLLWHLFSTSLLVMASSTFFDLLTSVTHFWVPMRYINSLI